MATMSVSSTVSTPHLLRAQLRQRESPFLTITASKLHSSVHTEGLRFRNKSSLVVLAPTTSRTGKWRSLYAVAEGEASTSEAARRLYIGNIPRSLSTEELRRIVEEHGAADKVEVMYDKYSGRSRRFGFATMKTVEEANAVIEKLNGTEIGGREIKVNITEQPLSNADISLMVEESQFIDSPHKVYVGNLAKTVTTDLLKSFFSEKGGNVLSAKVSRVPGTSKSSGFGFVTFSSQEDVEAAITSCNNAALEGQKIRVNKA